LPKAHSLLRLCFVLSTTRLSPCSTIHFIYARFARFVLSTTRLFLLLPGCVLGNTRIYGRRRAERDDGQEKIEIRNGLEIGYPHAPRHILRFPRHTPHFPFSKTTRFAYKNAWPLCSLR
jgi:hypothetical protein